MNHECFEKEGIVVLKLKGSLSAQNLNEVTTFFSRQIEQEKFRFVFDLSEVTWMGSKALGLIATAIREAMLHNTRVRLVNPNPKIVGLLQDTSLLELCHVFASVEQAIQSFQ